MMDAQHTALDQPSIEVDYLEIDNELFNKLFKYTASFIPLSVQSTELALLVDAFTCSECEDSTRCINCTRLTHWVQA